MPGDGHDLLDARRLAGDLLDLIHHALGTVERSTIGQLHRREQITLILDRDETGRHPRQAVAADGDQDQRDDDRNAAMPHHAPMIRV